MLHLTRFYLLIGLLGFASSSFGQSPVVLVPLEGAIGPASADFVVRAIKRAATDKAPLVIIRMDTPGGLDTSMRQMIKEILASPVPVATYVAPGGSRAASAGTFILYASHFAAMAPGTNLGAASPVSIGGSPQKDDKKGGGGEDTMTKKVTNDAVAYIRGLAEMRGRNADWAEKAVREAATLTADDALKEKVIDIVAPDAVALLARLDGRAVNIGGAELKLATKGRAVTTAEPDWRMRLISAIADPNIAFILMMVGIYGVLFELWSPGVYFPGVLGGICLLLGLAALSVLPVNFAGLGLVVLGVALMVGEHFTPGIGALGVGGAIALVIGAAFLFDPAAADIDISVSWPVIAVMATLSLAMGAFVFGFALQARRRRVATGAEQMIGMEGRVVAWAGDAGTVRVHGEVWSARSDQALAPGDRIRVGRRDGLVLRIKPF